MLRYLKEIKPNRGLRDFPRFAKTNLGGTVMIGSAVGIAGWLFTAANFGWWPW